MSRLRDGRVRQALLALPALALCFECSLPDSPTLHAEKGGAGGDADASSGGDVETGGEVETGGTPSQGGSPSSGGVTTTTGGNGGDAASSGGSPSAEGGSCTGDLTSCSGSCVNLQTSGDDCGACGHSCGGGACEDGKCQPSVVLEVKRNIADILVDGDQLYFTITDPGDSGVSDYGAQACTVTDCRSPRQLAGGFVTAGSLFNAGDWLLFTATSFASADPLLVSVKKDGTSQSNVELSETPAGALLSVIVASGTDIAWTFSDNTGMYCRGFDGTKCGTRFSMTEPWGAIAIVQGTLFYASNGNALVSCDLSDGCESPLTYTGTTFGRFIGVKDGIPYRGTPIEISACPAGVCSHIVDSLRGALAYAISDKAVYWSEKELVRACKLPSCANGPYEVTSGYVIPGPMLAAGGFVYWVVRDQYNLDGGSPVVTASRVLRIAE
jgi:hypothetical protein